MFVVTTFSTGKVHIAESNESVKTLCGQVCKSNIINDFNNGFGDIRDTNKILNVPKITCKKCLSLFNR